MKFEVRDAFKLTPQELWDSLLDPVLEAKLAEISQSTVEPLEERQEGDILVRRVRVIVNNPAFGQVTKLLGADRFAYVQELRIDAARMTAQWKAIPPVAETQLSASGSWFVVAHADGAERVAQGDVTVKIPLVGGRLEKSIVDALTKVYKNAAELRRRYLSKTLGRDV